MNPQDNANQTPTPNAQADQMNGTVTETQQAQAVLSVGQGYTDLGLSSEPTDMSNATQQAVATAPTYDGMQATTQQSGNNSTQPSIGADTSYSLSPDPSVASGSTPVQAGYDAQNAGAADTTQATFGQTADVNTFNNVNQASPDVSQPGAGQLADPAALTASTAPVTAPHSEKKTIIVLAGAAIVLAAAIVMLFIL